jgi:tyrosine-protein phosphatase YwqE
MFKELTLNILKLFYNIKQDGIIPNLLHEGKISLIQKQRQRKEKIVDEWIISTQNFPQRGWSYGPGG